MIASRKASSPAGSAPGTGTGMRVARGKVACYLRFGVPDAGSVSPAQCFGKRAGLAGVAQLVEHLICNQRVGGSNPFASSKCFVSSRTAEARSGKIPVRSSFREKRPPKGSTGEAEHAKIVRAAKLGLTISATGSRVRSGSLKVSAEPKVRSKAMCTQVPSVHEFTHRWVSG